MVEERRTVAGLTVHVLRGAGNCHSIRFDLVRGASPEGEAATDALWRFLRASARWDKLEFDFVPPGSGVERLVGAAARDGFPTERVPSWTTPYVPLTDGHGGEAWLAGTTAKFRANLRRRMRNLSATGPVTLQRFVEADPAALETIYEIERRGWKGREECAIACHENTRQFYDEIADQAARLGYLCLYVLTVGGRAIAAHFGLSRGGRYFMPKVAYDESYGQYAPGQLLMHAVLADCASRGLRELDFLGDVADWKAEWTAHVRPHSLWHVFQRTSWGRTLHAATFGARRVVRSLLGRGPISP
jgi:CelD/BcsL family acetyltransferase involved in cellulose biosynthesis